LPEASPKSIQRTASGASRSLRRIPAIVSFLNPQPALSLVGGNRSSCPLTDLAVATENGSGRLGVICGWALIRRRLTKRELSRVPPVAAAGQERLKKAVHIEEEALQPHPATFLVRRAAASENHWRGRARQGQSDNDAAVEDVHFGGPLGNVSVQSGKRLGAQSRGGQAALPLAQTRAAASRFVFPWPTRSEHLEEIYRQWAVITADAQIAGLRRHDLRHSFAFELVSTGFSLPLIGQLLGHSQPTRQRGIRIHDEAQRIAVERVGARISNGGATSRAPFFFCPGAT
jgi:hypothetical protein